MNVADSLTNDGALKECAREIVALFAILLLYVILNSLFAVGCPIKFLTGLSCPGCGLTRAWLSFFALDPESAFAFHPLFWSVPFLVVLAVMLQHDVFKGHIKTIAFGITVSFCVIFVVLWLIRFGVEPDMILTGTDSLSYDSAQDIVNWRIPAWIDGILSIIH